LKFSKKIAVLAETLVETAKHLRLASCHSWRSRYGPRYWYDGFKDRSYADTTQAVILTEYDLAAEKLAGIPELMQSLEIPRASLPELRKQLRRLVADVDRYQKVLVENQKTFLIEVNPPTSTYSYLQKAWKRANYLDEKRTIARARSAVDKTKQLPIEKQQLVTDHEREAGQLLWRSIHGGIHGHKPSVAAQLKQICRKMGTSNPRYKVIIANLEELVDQVPKQAKPLLEKAKGNLEAVLEIQEEHKRSLPKSKRMARYIPYSKTLSIEAKNVLDDWQEELLSIDKGLTGHASVLGSLSRKMQLAEREHLSLAPSAAYHKVAVNKACAFSLRSCLASADTLTVRKRLLLEGEGVGVAQVPIVIVNGSFSTEACSILKQAGFQVDKAMGHYQAIRNGLLLGIRKDMLGDSSQPLQVLLDSYDKLLSVTEDNRWASLCPWGPLLDKNLYTYAPLLPMTAGSGIQIKKWALLPAM